MTREEASFILANIDRRVCDDELSEALDMAIKALEQEQQSEWERDHEVLKAYADGQESVKLCKDAISRQAAIDAIWDGVNMDIYTREVKECLEKLPSVSVVEKVGRWIPVSERLPEAGEYVGDVAKYYLVQNEYGDMLVARYAHSGYWEQIYQLKPYADEIIAWMPLPQPYKGESENKE